MMTTYTFRSTLSFVFILALRFEPFSVHCGTPAKDELDFIIATQDLDLERLRLQPQNYMKIPSYATSGFEGSGLLNGDLLVGVNGEELSELGLQEAINHLYKLSQGRRFGNKKDSVLFPLVHSDELGSDEEIPEEGLQIGAFVRIEIVEAKNMTFRPTGKHREDLWAVKEDALQVERARQQAELEEKRRVAAALAAAERQARERAEQRERARAQNALRRAQGEGFTFDAELTEGEAEGGGFGIAFAEDAARPIVASADPALKGHAEGVRKGDGLISVNGIDVTEMVMTDVISKIMSAEFPKVLVFQVFARGEEVRVQSHFELFITSPALLAGQPAARRPERWGGNITAFDPCAPVSLGFADPRTGCRKLTLPTDEDGNIAPIITAVRGECTFVDKARTIQEAGGQMIVVVNQDDTVMDMPAGRMTTDDISAPIVMIGKTDGENIEKVLSMGYHVTAALAPQHLCDQVVSSPLQQQNKPPRMKEDSGGGLILMSPGFSKTFDFADALFGPPAKDNIVYQFVYADPNDGCDPEKFQVRVRGAVAVVERGGCSFSQKTVVAQALGAAAVALLNNEDQTGVFRVMAPPEDEDIIRIPTVMISKRAGEHIREAAKKKEQIIGRFVHTEFEGQYG